MGHQDVISDVIIVGGGLAGLYAANTASINFPKLKITLLTSEELGSGGCSKRTHGVNAAVNKNDNWKSHMKDTIEGGGGINNLDLVKTLCQNIPEQIKELESLGITFDGDTDKSYNLGTYGGSSFSRSLHIYDMTGLIIIQELVKQVILNGCHIKENRWAIGLNKENNLFSVNAINKQTNHIENYIAKAVVLATGGGACVYPISSISFDKLGSGILMAYNIGASLIDMEMVQFHPTGILLPGSPGNGSLLEEEMRTQGGILLNKYGKRYMYDYDKRGELATRDIVARSSFIEIMEGRGTDNKGIIFDISMIDKKMLLQRFPKTLKRLRSWNVDLITHDKLEISPTAHFLMGGISINSLCETDIKGLFACGEDAGGVHGGNRLGGNGVAEALVFGKIAGMEAGKYSQETFTPLRDTHEDEIGEAISDTPNILHKSYKSKTFSYYKLDKEEYQNLDLKIKNMMWNNVGLIRNGADLSKTSKKLKEMKEKLDQNRLVYAQLSEGLCADNVLFGKSLMNKLELATLITCSALKRKNSLGAHYRTDDNMESNNYNVKIKIDEDISEPIVFKENTQNKIM